MANRRRRLAAGRGVDISDPGTVRQPVLTPEVVFGVRYGNRNGRPNSIEGAVAKPWGPPPRGIASDNRIYAVGCLLGGQLEVEVSASARVRPLRADAQRNRDALVAAAGEMFRTRGPEVSMLEIAEAAGVGVGTLYRHFPHRESLVMAVYHESLTAVCDEAIPLLAGHPADEAIELWLRRMVEHVRTNRPLKLILMQTPAVADWSPVDPAPPLFAESDTLLVSTMSQLLDAAAQRRLIEAKAEPRDLLRTASALTQIDAGADEAARIIGLLVDGLRHRRPGAAVQQT